MHGYSINVSWGLEDKMYVAVCQELDGLMAVGKTHADAVKELQMAIDLLLEVMEEEGETPPSPQPYREYSGQFRVRIPRTLHAKLTQQAKEEGVSLNSLVTMYLAEASGRFESAGIISDKFNSNPSISR